MKLIIGGSFQGKTRYAQERYALNHWADGRTCGWKEVLEAPGIHHFHEFIRRQMKEGETVSDLGTQMVQQNPDAVVVTNELGYGVVPMDAFDRKYREASGRICTVLAENADEVIRVVCGIGQVIK